MEMSESSRKATTNTPKGIKKYEESILDFLLGDGAKSPKEQVEQSENKPDELTKENAVVEDVESRVTDDRKSTSKSTSWSFPGAPWIQKIIEEKARLPIDEERALIRDYQETGNKQAKDRVIAHHYKLAYSQTSRIIHPKYESRITGLEFEDLFQAGVMGLLVAIDRYDVDMGHRFSTYATHWVRQQTIEMVKRCHIVAIPANLVDLLYKIEKQYGYRVSELRALDEASVTNIAANMGIEEYHLNLISSVPLVSTSWEDTIVTAEIDSNYDDEFGYMINTDHYEENGEDVGLKTCDPNEVIWNLEALTIADTTADHSSLNPLEMLELKDLNKHMRLGLEDLDERESDILERYFGLDYEHEALTLEEIGVSIGLTRERVRQLKERALQKLRHPARSGHLRDFC